MGLSDRLATAAVRRAHLLVVEVPGHWQLRALVELTATARGWTVAASPGDADVLVVCGTAGQRLAERIDQVWHQLPGPRARVAVTEVDEVDGALDEAAADLLDTDRHRRDARERPPGTTLLPQQHADAEMAPSGIPLAEGGEDRDALEMDVLHLSLGPVLPHWPPGLVLHCALQGDVVVGASAEVLDVGAPEPAPAGARRCDALAGLLALAGWDDAAAQARWARDLLLAGDSGAAAARLDRLARRVSRSRTLRWSLRGLGRVEPETARRLGLPETATGDCHDRLVSLLSQSRRAVRDGDVAEAVAPPAGHLATLVTGLDLAAVRLVVASLGAPGIAAARPEEGAGV